MTELVAAPPQRSTPARTGEPDRSGRPLRPVPVDLDRTGNPLATESPPTAKGLVPSGAERLVLSGAEGIVEAPPSDADLSPALEIHLVAHGSPDPRHAGSVRRIARRLQRASSATVTFSFLEHDEPRTALALAPAMPRGVRAPDRTTVVVPLLLTAGVHWHRDLPPVIGPMGQRSILLPPPEPAHFAEAVLCAARPGMANGGRIVLATAGSTRPGVHERMGALAARVKGLGTDSTFRQSVDIVVADRPDAVASLARPGDVVVPILIADGIFADRIRAAAGRQQATVTAVLGDTDAFAARVLDLIGAAAFRGSPSAGPALSRVPVPGAHDQLPARATLGPARC